MAVVSGCTDKSQKNTNSMKDNASIFTSKDVSGDINEDKSTTYNNYKLGFSLEVESKCLVNEEKSSVNFDEGKRESFIIKCNGRNVGSIDFTSEDYEEGVGEGCCFYYSNKSIDLSKSNNVLMNELQSFYPKDIKRISLDEKAALRFFSKKEYVNDWVKEMIVLPFNKNGYTNVVINGPVLKEMERGNDYDVMTLNLDSEENILFENLIKSLKFY